MRVISPWYDLFIRDEGERVSCESVASKHESLSFCVVL